MRATVLVRPKQGILDPQGQAVESSLRQLGFSVDEARIGRVVDLEVEAADPAAARADVERMCEQLLANPLIESYEIALAESPTSTNHSRASASSAFPAPVTTAMRGGHSPHSTRIRLRLAHRDRIAGSGRRRPARRLLLRRLPALRSNRTLRPCDGSRRRFRGSRRPRARHMQRLPGPL